MIEKPTIDNYLLKTSHTVSLITWINYRNSSLIFFDSDVIATIMFNQDIYLYHVIMIGCPNMVWTVSTLEEGKKLVLSEIDTKHKAINLRTRR